VREALSQLAQQACPSTSQQYLFVSDTNNHCIKRIDLQLGLTTVVAGSCTHPGFMDGPNQFNLLNYPSALGVTRSGEVVFFDSGNEYMRVLYSDGTVDTLLNGACTQYPSQLSVNNYELRMSLCYVDWLELNAPPTSNHTFNAQDTINTCTKQYSLC